MKTLEKINRVVLIVLAVALGVGVISHGVGSFMRVSNGTPNLMLESIGNFSSLICTMFFGLFIMGFIIEISLGHFFKK